MNEVYPQLVQVVNGETPANVSRTLSRRSRFKDLVRHKACVDWDSYALTTHTIPGTRRLFERESELNDSPSYTATAIWCADSVDPRGTTMKAVFEGIVSTAQNVSHMCESLFVEQ